MIIQGINCRAVPIGGASTGWQIQVKTKRKKDGSEYWHGIDRYPSSVLEAAQTVFEMEAVHGSDEDLASVVDALKASCTAICDSVSKGEQR